jgi:hypothetical protein
VKVCACSRPRIPRLHHGRCAELSTEDPFVIPPADATSTDMRISCRDNTAAVVCPNALSRSPLLVDIHQKDADGRVSVPCNANTHTAWLTDDHSGLPPDTPALVLDVIRVRSVYTKEHWMLPCATGSWTLLEIPLTLSGHSRIREKGTLRGMYTCSVWGRTLRSTLRCIVMISIQQITKSAAVYVY